MKRFATLLTVFGVAAIAGSVGHPAAAAKEPAVVHATAALAVVGIEGRTLAWVDPRTLKQLKRGTVKLGNVVSPVLSPSGNRVAVGSKSLGIRLVDPKRMKLMPASIARRSGWTVEPIAWPVYRRLFALEWNDASNRFTLAVADPISRKVLRRLAVDGYTNWTRTPTGVVALGRLEEGIGPASLLVVDQDGGTRTVALERISAGGESSGTEEEPDYRMASPALAVDLVARRAYVVGQSTLVADVDLSTLAISYRDTRRPAAITKIVTGWHRQAVALGDGRLALAGSNYDRLRRDPAGLQLVDVQTGTMRNLEERASFALVASGRLLVAGDRSAGDGTWTGMGLAAYTLDGDKLWHVLDGEPVSWVQTTGGYAYVVGKESHPETVRVIDIADGSVRTVRGQMPFFVTG